MVHEKVNDKNDVVDPNAPLTHPNGLKGGTRVEGSEYGAVGGSRRRRPRKSKSGKTLRRKKMTMKQQKQQKQQRRQQRRRR